MDGKLRISDHKRMTNSNYETCKNFTIRKPGALHRARLMAILVYSLKIYLFRSQFELTSRELSELQAFDNFVVKVYIKCWYTSSCAKSAPYNDINILKELDYDKKKSNNVIRNAATKSFSKLYTIP